MLFTSDDQIFGVKKGKYVNIRIETIRAFRAKYRSATTIIFHIRYVAYVDADVAYDIQREFRSFSIPDITEVIHYLMNVVLY